MSVTSSRKIPLKTQIDRSRHGLRTWLSTLLADANFRLWRWRNEGGTFADYYAATVTRRLDSGLPHRTLGLRQYTKQAAYDAPLLTIDLFKDRGRDQVELLRRLGLEPHFRCIDYGCGSLRLGQHLISLLPPGHYCGLDVTDRFYLDGIRLIEPALLAAKQPRLAVIGDEVIAELAGNPPDFLFSYAVLKHIPPQELRTYFTRIGRLIGPQTRALIFFSEASDIRRISSMNWAYPGEKLRQDLLACYPTARIDIRRLTYGRHPDRRELGDAVLCIQGQAVGNQELPQA